MKANPADTWIMSTTAIHIRRMTTADITISCEIKRLAATRAYSTIVDSYLLGVWLDHNAGDKHYRHRIGRKDYVMLVAEIAGEVVGVGYFRIYNNRADIGGVYVKQSGRGIGTALMHSINSAAHDLKLARARVLIWQGNDRALKVATKQGFEPIKKSLRDMTTGKRINYYERDL